MMKNKIKREQSITFDENLGNGGQYQQVYKIIDNFNLKIEEIICYSDRNKNYTEIWFGNSGQNKDMSYLGTFDNIFCDDLETIENILLNKNIF